MTSEYPENLLEDRMPKNKLNQINKLLQFAHSMPEIESIVLTGPYSVKEQTLHSDINLLVFIDERNFINTKQNLIELFKNELNYLLDFGERFKMFFYSKDSKIINIDKIEISLINDLNKIKILKFEGFKTSSDVEELILYSKNSDIKEKVRNRLMDIKNESFNMVEEIIYNCNTFIEKFEIASTRGSLGESYYFAFYLTEAYQILYRLDYLTQNKTFPEFSSSDDYWNSNKSLRFEFFQEYYPQIKLGSMNDYKEKYASVFLEILKELSKQFDISLNFDSIKRLLNSIIKRDYIWNLRDFSNLNNDNVISGKLYRSSALARYKDNDIFQEVIKTTGIKTIIDLRTETEKIYHFYGDILEKHNVKYFLFPIGPKKIEMEGGLKYTSYDDSHAYYEIFPRYYQEELKQLLISMIDMEFPIMIHCYAGRDRTGIVIALIMKFLGFKDEEVVQEYLNSGVLASKKSINITFKVVNEYGGIEEYFRRIGLSKDQLSKLKLIFQKEN